MANEERRLKAGAHGRKDTIMGALREQSTHYAAGTRITVYERLGLNKPGFWADHQERKLEQQKTDENYEAPMPKWRPQMLEYQSQWPEYEGAKTAEKKASSPGSVKFGETQPGTATGTGKTRREINRGMLEVTANVWKSLGKAHPWVSASSSNLIMTEKYSTAYALAQTYGAALQKDPMASMSKVATQYYFDKAGAAAVARDNIPFGHGEPTQFEKMSAMLAKPRQQIKGNTRGVSVLEKQKTSVKLGISYGPKSIISGPGKTQLNVHANGYASNYPYPNF